MIHFITSTNGRIPESDDCSRCVYCDNFIGGYFHEHDHFPIPKQAGGLLMASACQHCHSLKDRIPLYKWPLEFTFEATNDFARLDLVPTLGSREVPEMWSEMNRASRILWAKITRYMFAYPTREETKNMVDAMTLARDTWLRELESAPETPRPVGYPPRPLRKDSFA